MKNHEFEKVTYKELKDLGINYSLTVAQNKINAIEAPTIKIFGILKNILEYHVQENYKETSSEYMKRLMDIMDNLLERLNIHYPITL